MKFIFALGVLWSAGCGMMDPEMGALQEAEPAAEITFDTIRTEIFSEECGCHVEPNGIGIEQGGLNLGDYNAVMTGGRNSAVNTVIPGDPENSVLLQKLTESPPFGAQMPYQGPRLDPELQAMLRAWIEAGAPQ